MKGLTEVALNDVEPDEFAVFMQRLQPPTEYTPIVVVQQFKYDENFQYSLLMSIRENLYKSRSPGPKLIRPDKFRLLLYLFINVATAFSRAIGIIGRVPSHIHSVLLRKILQTAEMHLRIEVIGR